MTCAPSHLIPERNLFGRPKEHDRMKIVNDFIEYARTHPDCLTVPCFTSTIGIDSGMMRRWALESEDFRTSFNIGKELIGINRLKSTNNKEMDRGLYLQVVGNYDIDINKFQREEKEFDAKLKIDEAKSVDASFSDKFDKFNKAIYQARESSKALKSSDISNNAEAKS